MNQRGLGLIELVIAVAVVAAVGYLLMQYLGATSAAVQTLQRTSPLGRVKLTADQATLTSIQGLVRVYHAEQGRFPPDKATVVGLLGSAPRFQCAGNDFDYNPATGSITLAIADDSRC